MWRAVSLPKRVLSVAQDPSRFGPARACRSGDERACDRDSSFPAWCPLSSRWCFGTDAGERKLTLKSWRLFKAAQYLERRPDWECKRLYQWHTRLLPLQGLTGGHLRQEQLPLCSRCSSPQRCSRPPSLLFRVRKAQE